MKLWKKSLAGLIGAVLLTALAAGTALAAESRTKITSVSITIDSDELAEELEVTYEPVKIGVLANSENVENAVKWLTKLAEELS